MSNSSLQAQLKLKTVSGFTKETKAVVKEVRKEGGDDWMKLQFKCQSYA